MKTKQCVCSASTCHDLRLPTTSGVLVPTTTTTTSGVLVPTTTTTTCGCMPLLEAELRHARELLAEKDARIAALDRALLLLEHRQEPRKKGIWGMFGG